MARKRTISYKSKDGQQLKELRQSKFNQINQVVINLENKQTELKEKEKFVATLVDVAEGLYDENDKLFKKSPVQEITKLAVEQVNEVIKDTKQLADKDVYVQKLKVFVPAGDNPEVRDVVTVLDQVKRGLNRFKENIKPLQTEYLLKLEEAKVIKQCLEEFLENDIEVENTEVTNGTKFPHWFDVIVEEEDEYGDEYEYSYFNFNRLDKLDIFKHFEYVE